MTPDEKRTHAIDCIIAAIQSDWSDRGGLPGTNLRPIAERIYSQASKDVWEAVTAEMNEASARAHREAAAVDPHYYDGWIDNTRYYLPGFMQ